MSMMVRCTGDAIMQVLILVCCVVGITFDVISQIYIVLVGCLAPHQCSSRLHYMLCLPEHVNLFSNYIACNGHKIKTIYMFNAGNSIEESL